MADYIEREAVLKIVDRRVDLNAKTKPMFQELISMPAADVAPVVHGTPMLRYRPERYERYEEKGLNENGEMLYLKRTLVDEKSYAMYCPYCGKRLCSRFKNYCPNCGAKMDGGEKDA